MDKLPTEILDQIFYFLYYYDKLQCMLVCRRLERQLRVTTLFDSLRVTTIHGFEQTVKRLDRNPQDGIGIINLRLDLKFDNKNLGQGFELKRLTQYLPNVKFFSCYCHHNKKGQQYPGFVLPSLNDRIEEAIDESERLITIPSLSSNKFIHLKKLTIKADNTPLSELIESLGNAPNLTHLTLKNIIITFSDMDSLHKALPLLTSLSLVIKNLPPIHLLPSDIIPAITVVSFSFTAIGFVPICRQAEWVDYIKNKYTMLSEFNYTFHTSGYYLTDGGERYREWFRPLFYQLGSQLKSLSLDAKKIPMNLFEILDNAGCQIQHLKLYSITPRLLDWFENSKQRNHVKTLETKFKNNSYCHGDGDWKNKTKKLNKLSVPLYPTNMNSILQQSKKSATAPGLDYDGVLDMCSETLKYLDIRVPKIDTRLTSRPFVYHSISELSLTDTTLPYGFGQFISHSFINLRYLKFTNCKFHNNMLDLSSLCLSQLQLEEDDQKNILVIKSDNNKRCYSFDTQFQSLVYRQRNYDSYKMSYRSIPMEKMLEDPDLTVVCDSIDKLYVCRSTI